MNSFILIMLIVNALVSLGIGIFQLGRNKRLALICFLTGLFVPVFGPAMCAAIGVRFKEGRHHMAVEETIRSYKIQESEYMDEERLRNVVPAEDAFSISGESQRRSFLLGLLRQKDIGSLAGVLKKALTNEDAEASHYAASAIMELQRSTYSDMMAYEAEYKADAVPDYGKSIRYAAAIMLYLDSSEVGELENFTFRSRYEKVMEYILGSLTEECSPTDFENMIGMLLKQGRLTEAAEYGKKFGERFPDTESSYILRMQTAYCRHNEREFTDALSDLKKSSVLISAEGLDMVRFWSKAVGKGAV